MDLITQWDMDVLRWVREYLTGDVLDPIMVAITHLGEGGIAWLAVAGVLVFFRKTRRAAVCMVATMLVCLLVGNLGLKNLFARERPYFVMENWEVIIPFPNGYSFPSGHTMHALGAATALLLCDRLLGLCVMVPAVLVALSRIYLGVHYPTDVVGGVIVGVAVAFGVCALVDRIWKKKEVPAGE